MVFIKRHAPLFAEGIFLFFIFFASQLPLRDFDIWFHIKAGELFVNLGHLPFVDYFSFAAQGREWIHFEWLFQIVVYFLSKIGLWIIPPFISIFVVILYFFLLRIFHYIFGLGLFPRLLISFVFFVLTYEFYTARPHIIAYTFLTITCFLILARIFKDKKWVYATPFITLIWTNIHSTGFLSWGIMLSFAVLLLLQWLVNRDKNHFQKCRDLFICSGVNFLVTISPPMGFLNYKLLWRFFLEREFLGVFIAEWAPTSPEENPVGYFLFTALLITTVLVFLFLTIKKKLYLKNVWGIPFIIMALTGYSASRNVFPATLGLLILLAWNIRHIADFLDTKRAIYQGHIRLLSTFAIALVILVFFGYLLIEKQRAFASRRLYYPVQSTEFAKRYLNGNMFNDYTYGGYILYHVYPRLRVLIDGRAEIYLCCEMHDYLSLAINKYLPDDEYYTLLTDYWNKYDISFAIISTQKNNVMRRIARLLNADPHWTLVFWDDDSQVFVKRNGKNDEIIAQLEAKNATPYLREPFVKNNMNEALSEYERMDKIAPSAHTSNAIGFILMQKGRFDEAKERFNSAIDQDPTFESPYMNLAELAAKDGDLDKAISLYTKAQYLAEDRGLIYVRLGQLVLERSGDKERARKTWELGIKNTIDGDAKDRLKELLSTL